MTRIYQGYIVQLTEWENKVVGQTSLVERVTKIQKGRKSKFGDEVGRLKPQHGEYEGKICFLTQSWGLIQIGGHLMRTARKN
jgi:hypothetical protein